jgi:hypothetical protein
MALESGYRDQVQAIRDLFYYIESLQVAYYNRDPNQQTDGAAYDLQQMYASLMGYVNSLPAEVQQAVHQRSKPIARQASVHTASVTVGPATANEVNATYPPTAVTIDLRDSSEPTADSQAAASVSKIMKRTLAEVTESDKPPAKEIDTSQFLHRPNGLSFVMFGTVLPLLALMLLTLYPDANVYLFTNSSTSSVLEMVPIPQLSRVHCAPFYDFQTITREALAIWLQDYNLCVADIDLLYCEDMHLDNDFANFRLLAHDLQQLYPQLLVASRSCTSNYTLGAPSKYQHNYDIHFPAAKVQRHQFASDLLVDETSTPRTTELDDDVKYIQFAYLLQETLDDIIHDAYGKLSSVGLLCYPEVQELIINEFTPAEQAWCYEDDGSGDVENDEADDPAHVFSERSDSKRFISDRIE